MPFDASGIYSLPTNPTDNFTDIAGALSLPIMKDGRSTTTAEIPFAAGLSAPYIKLAGSASLPSDGIGLDGSGRTHLRRGSTTYWHMDADGRLLSGDTPYLGMSNNPRFEINEVGVAAGAAFTRHVTPGGGGAILNLGATRAALGAAPGYPLWVGDGMGQVAYKADDGYSMVTAVSVQGAVDGAVSRDIVPGRFTVNVMSELGGLDTVFRIDRKKNIGNNIDSYGFLITGGGTRVWSIRDADVVPTTAPYGGGLIWFNGGHMYGWASGATSPVQIF